VTLGFADGFGSERSPRLKAGRLGRSDAAPVQGGGGDELPHSVLLLGFGAAWGEL
jgi:hypothetical protein